MADLPGPGKVSRTLGAWRGRNSGLTLDRLVVRDERTHYRVTADFMQGDDKVGEADVRYCRSGEVAFDRIALQEGIAGKGAMTEMMTDLAPHYASWGLTYVTMRADTAAGRAFAKKMGFKKVRKQPVWRVDLPGT